MHDVCTYLVELRGHLDEGEINAGSPMHLAVVRADPSLTRSMICTDQSGLIGLMRYLHGRGFTLLSVSRLEKDGPD